MKQYAVVAVAVMLVVYLIGCGGSAGPNITQDNSGGEEYPGGGYTPSPSPDSGGGGYPPAPPEPSPPSDGGPPAPPQF